MDINELMNEELKPNRKKFEKDPFGYSSLAWQKWGMIRTLAGFPIDIRKFPNSDELKNPLLWISQARAMSEAAKVLISNMPKYEYMPQYFDSICDSQYCACALMLVGYSLEICLKAMMILNKGIEQYTDEEKKFKHHKLDKLADFIPDLNENDKIILKILTHFVYWAGRYPDPGSGREDSSEEIFIMSEKHEISAKHLFETTTKIMNYTNKIS